MDAWEAFLAGMQSGKGVNMAEQSARCTMIGRPGREATGKSGFGSG